MHNHHRKRDANYNDLSSNISLLEAAASYDMYSYWIPAKNFEANVSAAYGGLPVWTEASATVPAGFVFSAALAEGITFYWRRHLEWRDGMVYGIPHMMHSTNVGDVVVGLDIGLAENGVAMPAITTTKTKTIAVPGTANLLQVPTETTYLNDSTWSSTNITEQYVGLYVHFYRLGNNVSDTCAGTTRFLGLELRYLEGTRGFGQKWDAIRVNR